jgi:hypothetical protein
VSRYRPPRLWTLVELQLFEDDMRGITRFSDEGTLVRVALSLLRVDPYHVLGTFPVSINSSEGWVMRVLELPEKRGAIVYSLDAHEHVVVLYRVLWGA